MERDRDILYIFTDKQVVFSVEQICSKNWIFCQQNANLGRDSVRGMANWFPFLNTNFVELGSGVDDVPGWCCDGAYVELGFRWRWWLADVTLLVSIEPNGENSMLTTLNTSLAWLTNAFSPFFLLFCIILMWKEKKNYASCEKISHKEEKKPAKRHILTIKQETQNSFTGQNIHQSESQMGEEREW